MSVKDCNHEWVFAERVESEEGRLLHIFVCGEMCGAVKRVVELKGSWVKT